MFHLVGRLKPRVNDCSCGILPLQWVGFVVDIGRGKGCELLSVQIFHEKKEDIRSSLKDAVLTY